MKYNFELKKIEDIENLKIKIEEYFNKCKNSKVIPNKIGLLKAIGYSKNELININSNIKKIIESANDYIESFLIEKATAKSQGAIWYLEASFGYKNDEKDGSNPIKIELINSGDNKL